MMKKLLLPFVLIACSLNAQQKETVDLKWKINDTLTYNTVMQDVALEKNTEETEKDSISEEMGSMFKAMQKQLSGLKYETKLFPDKNGNVDIAMMLKRDKTDTTETLISGMARMNGNVVLRGKVSTGGDLLSFYYKSSQNNLISILFELPTKPVAIGEEWDLQVDLISMDQNFIADTLYKKNVVRLKDIKRENGHQIAVVEYDIEEFVAGDLGKGMMMFSNNKGDTKTFMRMTHKATAQFDIAKGYWVSYEGVMDVETNFSLMGMGGNKRTKFKLIPEK